MRKMLFLMSFILLTCCSCTILEQFTCNHVYEIQQENISTCSTAGMKLEVCNICGKNKRTVIPRVPHTYEAKVVNATCEVQGYTVNICSVCGHEEKSDFVDSLGHSYGEWTTINEPTDFSDGLKERKCLECGHTQEEYIVSTSYVDLDFIRSSYDFDESIECDFYEDLVNVFNTAVLNRVSEFSCRLNFTIKDGQDLLDNMILDCRIPFGFSVSLSGVGRDYTFSFNYNTDINLTTDKVHFTQHASLNYVNNKVGRSETFDDFQINNSIYEFKVTDSEQLFYTLERGVKPICEEGSMALTIYKEIKKVLREIINDDMSNLEKVKAIHDYLVLNVVYDQELLLMSTSNSPYLMKYRGFCLEGVFLDKKAVCEGFSKAFTVMCNMEGIPCVTIEGYQTQNPNGVGHAWNKVYVNDSWYIVDVTSDGTVIDNKFEILSYRYFLISEDVYNDKYTGEKFNNIICSKNYSIYEKMLFEYNNVNYDFVITSQAEFDVIIAYFHKNASLSSSIEFVLDFDFGTSSSDEFKKALRQNNIYTGYSYIEDGKTFIVIK